MVYRSTELDSLNQLICTPCMIDYDAYFKTPALSVTDKFLCEIGLIRPPFTKPDWDNIGKKYCDMYNSNIWFDDSLVLNAPPKMVYRSTFTHQVKKIYGKIDVTKPIDWSLLP